MSEASEIKLITDFLSAELENKIIKDFVIFGGQYAKKDPPGYDGFLNHLPLLVESVKCKGKFIYFNLFNETKRFYVLHNLRLAGRWQTYKDKYCKLYIEIENKKIWFRDTKCTSYIEFTQDEKILTNQLKSLGPDILTNEFSLPLWKKLIQTHCNKNITIFLTQQSIISGIGNYIKSESLYYAGISPLRKTGSLTENEQEKLYEGIRIISRVSYNKGGVNIMNESNDNNYYDSELKIYKKKNAEKTMTLDGRITYWDPDLQY